MAKRRADLTFKYNLKRGRHGWVRLTPAYSVKVVQEILDENPRVRYVLDPFSGTGTTGLVCGELGVDCDLFDINPFLIWLARVKTADYTPEQLQEAQTGAADVIQIATCTPNTADLWTPPISNIDRWWSEHRQIALAKIYQALHGRFPEQTPALDLLLVAFCRLIIQWSNAAFNHQSMSFKTPEELSIWHNEEDEIYNSFLNEATNIIEAARQPVPGKVRVIERDSRQIEPIHDRRYDCVITSPPYPNRMSYIRELRPYMYWLGYLVKAREAGELDWKAIGGTWGIATSRLKHWEADANAVPLSGLKKIVAEIATKSPILANYVHKYFVDISLHFASLNNALLPGAHVFYIVGNSKFYDTLVPVETLYAQLMAQYGYVEVTIQKIRKRNSKKELFEYLVSGRRAVS